MEFSRYFWKQKFLLQHFWLPVHIIPKLVSFHLHKTPSQKNQKNNKTQKQNKQTTQKTTEKIKQKNLTYVRLTTSKR